MYDQHTRGMATTRHRSLVGRGEARLLLKTKALHTQNTRKIKKIDISNPKKDLDHSKLPAKLLHPFLRSNESNINQSLALALHHTITITCDGLTWTMQDAKSRADLIQAMCSC